jgi:deoxyribodipyrimidine photo-lyase
VNDAETIKTNKSMRKRAIVWFKTNLRLHDNEPLVRALEYSNEVYPVYCLDPTLFKLSTLGFTKMGSIRAKFLIDSLQNLDSQLSAIGSGLILLRGNPAQELAKLVKELHITKVFGQDEVAYEECQIQHQTETELVKLGCSLDTYETSTLYHSQDLPFRVRDTSDIFTKFRKQVEIESSIRQLFPAPISMPTLDIPTVSFPTLNDLGLPSILPDKRAVLSFVGGETEALKRLHCYFYESKAIETYKETRNGLVGDNYSSKFSAWLALGCISARYIYHQLKQYERQYIANDSTYWLVFELLWRDYFHFIMKKYNKRLFFKKGIQPTKEICTQHNPKLLKKWIAGNTGSDFVDANMLELKLTGFMSNRGRQNVASYLCNNLKLDWRYGAAYFEQQLIDYDVCSNWGNWAYIAGVGNDPRGNRYFNIEKQAQDYDPQKIYRKLWLS